MLEIRENWFKVQRHIIRSDKFKSMAPNSKVLYICLLDFFNIYKWEESDGRYWFFRSSESLENDTFMSERTISRAKKELDEKGFVKVRRGSCSKTLEGKKRSADEYCLLGLKLTEEDVVDKMVG